MTGIDVAAAEEPAAASRLRNREHDTILTSGIRGFRGSNMARDVNAAHSLRHARMSPEEKREFKGAMVELSLQMQERRQSKGSTGEGWSARGDARAFSFGGRAFCSDINIQDMVEALQATELSTALKENLTAILQLKTAVQIGRLISRYVHEDLDAYLTGVATAPCYYGWAIWCTKYMQKEGFSAEKIKVSLRLAKSRYQEQIECRATLMQDLEFGQTFWVALSVPALFGEPEIRIYQLTVPADPLQNIERSDEQLIDEINKLLADKSNTCVSPADGKTYPLSLHYIAHACGFSPRNLTSWLKKNAIFLQPNGDLYSLDSTVRDWLKNYKANNFVTKFPQPKSLRYAGTRFIATHTPQNLLLGTQPFTFASCFYDSL